MSSDLDIRTFLFYLLGFVYSLFLGDATITFIQREYYSEYKTGQVQPWRSRVIGLLERALYTGSALAGFPEFIAIWLALKVVGQWERWKQDWSGSSAEQILKKGDTARSVFNGYLLGNGLSIAYGLTAALILKLIHNGLFISALAIALALPIASICLYVYVKVQAAKGNNSKRRDAGKKKAHRKRRLTPAPADGRPASARRHAAR